MRIRARLSYLLPILLPGVLLFPIIFKGQALYWGTPALQFLPWRAYALNQILQGALPLWNPLNGMGAPLLANYQLALFYPPGWVLFIVGAIAGVSWMAWAHTILLWAHLSWAGIGMSKLLKQLGLGDLSQAVGGLALSLCGYFIARLSFFSMIWTAAWLPWVLLAVFRLCFPDSEARRRVDSYIQLVLSLTLMLLAGHAQLSWYILLLATAWAIFLGLQRGGLRQARIVIVQYLGACILAFVLSAIQLIPTAEYLLESHRASSVDFQHGMTYSFWPWRFLAFVAPDIFGNPGLGDYWGYASYWEDAIYLGVLPVFLAISTLRFLFRKPLPGYLPPYIKNIIRFLWAVVLITIPLAIGWYSPIFPFLYRYVPTFNMFQAPARYMIWAEVALILLAGIGAELWCPPQGRGLYWLRLATAGGIAITIGTLLAWRSMAGIKFTFIRSVAITGIVSFCAGLLALFIPSDPSNNRRRFWQLLVVIFLGADLVFAGWHLNPVVDKGFYAAEIKAINELKDALDGHRLYISSQDEYQLKFNRFFRFSSYLPLENLENIRIAQIPNVNLLDAIHSANNFDPLLPGRYTSWLDFIENEPEKDRKQWLALMDVGLIERIDPRTYSGVNFEPVSEPSRLHWYPCVIGVSSGEEALEYLNGKAGSFSAPGEFLVVEGVIPKQKNSDCSVNVAAQQARILDENPLNLKVSINSEHDGYLLLADIWYPGWQGYVDGKLVSILRGNFLFRAIPVPKGNHLIEFRYQPISFYIGAVISLLGLVFVLSLKNIVVRNARVAFIFLQIERNSWN